MRLKGVAVKLAADMPLAMLAQCSFTFSQSLKLFPSVQALYYLCLMLLLQLSYPSL